MATAEGPARAHDRSGRRHPFSGWMKRLASLKSSSESGTNRWSNKRHASHKGKKTGVQGNNPYPLSGTINRPIQNDSSLEVERNGRESHSKSDPSLVYSAYENPTHATGGSRMPRPFRPTGTQHFQMPRIQKQAQRQAGQLVRTAEERSAAPSTQLYPAQNAQQGQTHGGSTQNSGNQQVQFSHQFPTSSTPATAVPSHLIPHSQSMTYSTATANNVLTDNASILTLASSSKRRRRNSLDTNASVRALAPSSVFGGSRESLPVSVLSGSVVEPSNASAFNAQGVLGRPGIAGFASAERISVYSSSGAAPLGSTGERGSFYTAKQSPVQGDGASIRSGAPSHGRNDSTAASISGGVGSPLAMTSGRMSRRSSGWGEINGDEDEDAKSDEKGEEKIATKPEISLGEPKV
ncbi:hypothetical protein N7512_004931 [Penicillium capsulatum]|nr:hypothetical protein N7512_004931 [Penicillium capsulatum]